MEKTKKSNKKVIIIVIILVLLMALAAVIVPPLLKSSEDNKAKEKKEVTKKEKKIEIDDNLVYYVARFNYKDGNVKSIETCVSLDDKEPCYVEDFKYKSKKLIELSVKDNEYKEADEKRKVSYDHNDNMVVGYDDDNIVYDKSKKDTLSVKRVDATGSGMEEELTRIKLANGRVEKILEFNDGDKANYEVIDYTYDSKGRISSINATHPYRQKGELFIDNSEYEKLTVTFKHTDGISIATVKDNDVEKGMFVYHYKDGKLDYVQMCSLESGDAQWLGDIHGFPGKEIWGYTFDVESNPILCRP